MRPTVTLRAAIADPDLLGNAIPGASWRPWRVLLIAAVGEALDDEERAILASFTGRDIEPGEPVEEFWCIIGRRSGKTRAAATLAVYLACLCDHSDALAPGERGVLPILAASTVQASRAFQHVLGIISHSPVLNAELQGEPTADVIRLAHVDIEVRAANFRTIRGITAVAAICDEIAFWQIETAANPDAAILAALRPALATTGGPLIVISSPYARRGELYRVWRRHYGPAGDRLILVANAPSRVFNPTLKQSVIDRAFEQDPASAAAEYGGEFRSDVEAFVSREVVEAAVVNGRFELPPVASIQYVAFVDPSGGSQDSMTLAIAHNDRQTGHVILDCVRERKPPFSPENVVTEFVEVLSLYSVRKVTGDRYGGEWCREPFRKHGIAYECSEKPKNDLYRDALPLLNSGKVKLLDNPRIVSQFIGLERRTARSGRDSIDHAPGAHDDLVNSVAGVICLASTGRSAPISAEYVASLKNAILQQRYGPSPGFTGINRSKA